MLIPHYHIYRKFRICPITRSHPPIEIVQLGVSLLMEQYNPPHPGAFIQRVYLEPNYLSCSELASRLQVSDILLKHLVNGYLDVSPEMALNLSKVLGRSPESWLLMQENFNIWKASITNEQHPL